MEQTELFDAPSPCIGVCENTPKGYCKGCMRSRDERFFWHQMSVSKQLHVMKLCSRRYQKALERRRAKDDVNSESGAHEPKSPQLDLI